MRPLLRLLLRSATIVALSSCPAPSQDHVHTDRKGARVLPLPKSADVFHFGDISHFTCLDLDADAIAYARSLVAATGSGERVRFVNANALRWRAEQQFHLVWSAGLFDYLPDRMFVRLLARLWQSVLPGGELVVGNSVPANPTRPFMELLADWYLLHRSPEQLRALAIEAGLPGAAISIGAEELGVNLFLHVRRPHAEQQRWPEMIARGLGPSAL